MPFSTDPMSHLDTTASFSSDLTSRRGLAGFIFLPSTEFDMAHLHDEEAAQTAYGEDCHRLSSMIVHAHPHSRAPLLVLYTLSATMQHYIRQECFATASTTTITTTITDPTLLLQQWHAKIVTRLAKVLHLTKLSSEVVSTSQCLPLHDMEPFSTSDRLLRVGLRWMAQVSPPHPTLSSFSLPTLVEEKIRHDLRHHYRSSPSSLAIWIASFNKSILTLRDSLQDGVTTSLAWPPDDLRPGLTFADKDKDNEVPPSRWNSVATRTHIYSALTTLCLPPPTSPSHEDDLLVYLDHLSFSSSSSSSFLSLSSRLRHLLTPPSKSRDAQRHFLALSSDDRHQREKYHRLVQRRAMDQILSYRLSQFHVTFYPPTIYTHCTRSHLFSSSSSPPSSFPTTHTFKRTPTDDGPLSSLTAKHSLLNGSGSSKKARLSTSHTFFSFRDDSKRTSSGKGDLDSL